MLPPKVIRKIRKRIAHRPLQHFCRNLQLLFRCASSVYIANLRGYFDRISGIRNVLRDNKDLSGRTPLAVWCEKAWPAKTTCGNNSLFQLPLPKGCCPFVEANRGLAVLRDMFPNLEHTKLKRLGWQTSNREKSSPQFFFTHGKSFC